MAPFGQLNACGGGRNDSNFDQFRGNHGGGCLKTR